MSSLPRALRPGIKSSRRKLLEAITHKMGRDKLVWFGTRGTDSQSLLQLPNFKAVFSIVAPLDSISIEEEFCLEIKKKLRVDLDPYRIDNDPSPEAQEMHNRLYSVLGERSYLAFYRSSNFLTTLRFLRYRTVNYLGLFHEVQSAFDYKPWVESGLSSKEIDVPIVPWKYLGEEDRQLIYEHLESGPIVLRANRSDGGAKLMLVREPEEVDLFQYPEQDGFLAFAPYLDPNIPLNVNGCVYRDGRVTLHSPSLQLIGVPGLTKRVFGYCGNDFARIRELGKEVIDQLENIAIRCGKWLASQSYVGAFGVDALLFEGKLYVAEINPRFQGSSDLSSRIDQDLERPDMFLNHLAAWMGIDVEEEPHPSLWDLANEQPPLAQVVVHNIDQHARIRNHEYPDDRQLELMLLPRPGIEVMPEAILFRVVMGERVTEKGNLLLGDYSQRINTLIDKLFIETETKESGV